MPEPIPVGHEDAKGVGAGFSEKMTIFNTE
jgi:hypothetical protein